MEQHQFNDIQAQKKKEILDNFKEIIQKENFIVEAASKEVFSCLNEIYYDIEKKTDDVL